MKLGFHRSLFESRRDLHEVSMGPITFDIKLARELGYDDAQIDAIWTALRFIARGADHSKRLSGGTACEVCGGADVLQPAPASKWCAVCNRSTRQL